MAGDFNWVGPASVAAVISAIVAGLGWLINYRIGLRLERQRRREKIRDFQIALRAEIRSELAQLSSENFDRHLATISARYAADSDYSVTVPHPVRHVIFETLVAEIHILPEDVIDPVVLHARQRQAIERLVEDIRSPEFRRLPTERQLEIYGDYLQLLRYLRKLSEEAVAILDAEIIRG